MQVLTSDRFRSATLIDPGFDPENPEVLLELGLENPVDWDAVDPKGDVIHKKLDFVLTVDHVKVAGVPLGIHCVYARTVRVSGLHDGLYVYVLGLRPSRNTEGRDCDRLALETAVSESKIVRRRSWCSDIGQVRISWRHAPENAICLDNRAFVPEAAATETPRATEDEVLAMCAAFDAFCDEIDQPPSPSMSQDDTYYFEFTLDEPLPERKADSTAA